MSRKDLLKIARQVEDLERRLSLDGPQTDDELHAWILTNLGVDIPRVGVCEGHASPFKFMSDLYFQRTGSAIAMANRGGSKTFMVAILHLLNCKFKKGVECCTVGAIQAQADRCYAHFRKLVADNKADGEINDMKISKTVFKNGSSLEILPGTVNAVNGPHPQIVHVDEVELMDPEVYQESRNMSQGTKKGEVYFRAQDIITSTRKRGAGPMQELLDSVNEAKLQGAAPPYEVYAWCIFETAAQVENCQVARPELADCDRCDCDKVMSGRWEGGSNRTLKDICKGRFYLSRGWISHEDVINTFTKTSQGIWEAQQECSKPSTEGLVIPQFSLERHGIRRYDPDPELGPIYMSIDFGGTNPHAVNWYQVLAYEIEVDGFHGTKVRLREGTRVCFDEIYKAEIGNSQIADMICMRESTWRQKYKYWRVASRFADPQGKAARLDLARHNPPLPTTFKADRDVKEHVKVCVYLIEHDRFVVDVGRCEMFVSEIESWHYPRKKAGLQDDPEKPVDDFDHCMSNWRYAMVNINAIEVSKGMRRGVPVSTGRTYPTDQGAGSRGRGQIPVAYEQKMPIGVPKSERWRGNFGSVST